MSTKHAKQGLLDSKLRMKLLETFRDSFPLGTKDKDISRMEVLEAKLNELLMESSTQQKVILSLRSSDDVVKDCIKMAVQQKSQEKDTEIAAMKEEIDELRCQRLVDRSLIGDLNRDIHEMSKKGAECGGSM